MSKRELKFKKPFRRIVPFGSTPKSGTAMPYDGAVYETVTQGDFLREYYPSGHKINSPIAYPDIYREDVVPVYDSDGVETGHSRKIYKEAVPRYSFAFQQVITLKQLVHLCGNDIQFETSASQDTDLKRRYKEYRKGWVKHNMDISFYQLAKSVKTTGDGAVVLFLSQGKVGWKSLSFRDGDMLYPHYGHDGMLSVFARSYYDYDDDGDEVVEWLEVWDKRYYTLLKKNVGKNRSVVDRIFEAFHIDGYEEVEKKPHGFNEVPVAYHRDDDGPCWSASQQSIEGYEMSVSQMAHNNIMYGEPILVLQGDDVSIGNDIQGTIKSISMGNEDKASYLSSQSAAESYMKQIDNLYRLIYIQSFVVDPPELKSGDLPAAALKILYSPAVEKAMNDARTYQGTLDTLVRLFSWGYGIEISDTIGMTELTDSMKWWIEPYVHVNTSTVLSDLATAVQNGFCSRQTASERIETLYTGEGEWERIMDEQKERQQADLLYKIETEGNDAAAQAE